jgi:hypothetical protein
MATRWISGNLYFALVTLKEEGFSPDDAIIIIKQINLGDYEFMIGAAEVFSTDFVERVRRITNISEETLCYAAQAVYSYKTKAEIEDISTGDL